MRDLLSNKTNRFGFEHSSHFYYFVNKSQNTLFEKKNQNDIFYQKDTFVYLKHTFHFLIT